MAWRHRSRRPSPLRDDHRRQILDEIGQRSLRAVGRDLGIYPATLASAIAGTAREGTMALVALRWADLLRERDQEGSYSG